jgi:hypothetical protein
VRDTVFDIFSKECTYDVHSTLACACLVVLTALALSMCTCSYDIPFACLYMADVITGDGSSASLVNLAGYAKDANCFPLSVKISDGCSSSDGSGRSDSSDSTDSSSSDYGDHIGNPLQDSDACTLQNEFNRLFREVIETREPRQFDLTPYEEVQPCGGWMERPRYARTHTRVPRAL